MNKMYSFILACSCIITCLPVSAAEIGSTVTFGSYEQNAVQEDGTEPIEWYIASVEGDKTLLVSKYGLDTQPYNTEQVDTTWETSSLREWLNDAFVNSAFTKEEQEKIVETTLQNPDNEEYGTPGGNDTKDTLFLLSVDEFNQYLTTEEMKAATVTPYAALADAMGSETKPGWWWLRTPADQPVTVVTVHGSELFAIGDYVDYDRCSVRPAMWVELD